MNFDFDKKEKALREKVKGLFDPDARSRLAQLEKGDIHQSREVLMQWSSRLGESGYLSLGLENGKNSVVLTAIQESLAAISPSLYLSIEVNARIFGRLVALYGKPHQKAEILPLLRDGRLLGAVALSEDAMNIENDPLNTTGVPDRDGFLLSGAKGHVVNAPIADWIAVAGTLSGRRDEGVGFFLVKKGSEGLSIGQRLSTMGHRGVVISPVFLEGCSVSSEWVIGPFRDKAPLMTVRMWEDEVLTGSSLGLMQRCYESALGYAKEHKSGGRPIIAYQEVGFKLAEMLTLLQTAQLLAYRAAWMAEAGNREARILAHCAKVFCAESAEELSSQALQILGGQGYMHGSPAEEGYRNAKYLQIAGTSTEISRIKIGDGVLESA